MKLRAPVPGSENSSRAIAFALAAVIMLVPANFLPVLYTQNADKIRTDTILSGIVGLWQQGWWFLAVIVFIASIFIPILKLAGLSWLLIMARHGPYENARLMTRLYVVLSAIGRWSMLDVFLVAFLSGVVQFGIFAKAEPRIGIVAFASAVVLTVLATKAFDPRVLWAQAGPAAPLSKKS